MFNDLHDTIGTDNGVMHQMRAPAVPPLHPGHIHRITMLSFAYKHAIPHHNGVHRANNIEQLWTILNYRWTMLKVSAWYKKEEKKKGGKITHKRDYV